MNFEELERFENNHPNISVDIDEIKEGQEDAFLFRDESLEWYKNDKERATRVTIPKLETMTEEDVLRKITGGLKVEGITRITGYFTKVPAWNKGKIAELRDRKKWNVEDGTQVRGMKEVI
jgi:hypothetical protein